MAVCRIQQSDNRRVRMSVRSPTTRYRVKQRGAETSYRIENGSGLIDKPAGWSAYESMGQARRSGGAGCNKYKAVTIAPALSMLLKHGTLMSLQSLFVDVS